MGLPFVVGLALGGTKGARGGVRSGEGEAVKGRLEGDGSGLVAGRLALRGLGSRPSLSQLGALARFVLGFSRYWCTGAQKWAGGGRDALRNERAAVFACSKMGMSARDGVVWQFIPDASLATPQVVGLGPDST